MDPGVGTESLMHEAPQWPSLSCCAVSSLSRLCHLQRMVYPKGGLSWLFTYFPCFLWEVKYVSLPVPPTWIEWWMWLSRKKLSCEMSPYRKQVLYSHNMTIFIEHKRLKPMSNLHHFASLNTQGLSQNLSYLRIWNPFSFCHSYVFVTVFFILCHCLSSEKEKSNIKQM